MTGASSIRVAREFLAWYQVELPVLRAAAGELRGYLQDLLSIENVPVHVVSARAKDADSVSAKLLRKHYAQPRRRLTDRIGARVILYHASDVDRVTRIFRQHLDVRERDSVDKRRSLGLREFGYRSYHLVARLPVKLRTQPKYSALRGQVFEVQVRSLLEHVWAEIEHSVVYKSGADLPGELKRRFASLAGVLELLEHEFAVLVAQRLGLVESARMELTKGMQVVRQRRLDVPYALALLEVRWPEGRSFRQAQAEAQPFPPGIEQRFVLGLSASGVRTVGAFDRALTSVAIGRARRRYASEVGVAPDEVSHLAAMALLLGRRSFRLLDVFFPEFRSDLALRDALRV